MHSGLFFAAAAYLCWGLFPLYFKALQHIPAMVILPHRMVWSAVFLALLLVALRRWGWLSHAFRQRRVLLGSMTSAALLSLNWFVYIWAVNAGHIVDASLGYFMNPLVNILIGALFLHEKLRRAQWAALALAAAGVTWLALQGDALPWIGLVLAFSFAFYGVMRKLAQLGALEGLALESFLLFPFAFAALFLLATHDADHYIAASNTDRLLLMLGGPVTAIPLLLFAAGARRIPFSTLGFLQYLAPTGQLLLGVWVFHEPFAAPKIAGYAAIWVALVLYSAEGLWRSRQRRRAGEGGRGGQRVLDEQGAPR